MSLFGQGYDPRGKTRATDISDPVPAGKYLLEISKAEERDNKPKNGQATGSHLYTELTIKSQSYGGRKVFHRFNLRNTNPEAERIAHEEFTAMLDAIGMGDVIIKHPSQLLGKVFCGRIVIKDGQNEVKGWEDKSKLTGGAPAPAAAGQAPAKPAWQRGAAPAQSPASSPAPANHNGGAAAQSGPTDAGTETAPAAAADTTTQQTTAPSDAPARPKKPWEK